MSHFGTSELQVKRWIYRNLICPFGRICLFPLVGIVCGFSANLFVGLPQIYLWVCRRFICGFAADLFAAFPHTGIID